MAEQSTKSPDKRLRLIGEKLRKLRIEAGYTSAEIFAYDHDINRVQYWRMEKGSNFTMNSLMKILDVHKITPDKFFRGIN